jgi:hypothetical protein
MADNWFNRKSVISLMWHAYKWEERMPPQDWQPIEQKEHLDGFSAVLYQSKVREDVLCVSICGSQGGEDLSNCQSIFNSQIPAQYLAADEYINDLKSGYPFHKILLVGHSLGGVIGKLCFLTMSDDFPLIGAMTANSPGVGEILTRLGWSLELLRPRESHIKQWIVANDIIGCYGQHVGTTYVVPPVPMRTSVFDPHRAWDDLKTASAIEARPSFAFAWSHLVARHPEAEFLLPLLKNGTLTVADLYAIAVNGMSDTILMKIGGSQVGQLFGQISSGLGSLFS